MSSEKKILKKPEVTAFASAEDAIAYYTKHGRTEHVEAVEKLRSQVELQRRQRSQDEAEARDIRPRRASAR